MSNIIPGLSDLPSTDTITDAALEAAVATFLELRPATPEWEAIMVLNLVARDWSHGEEERALKALTNYYFDLTGGLRIIAVLVGSSKAEQDAPAAATSAAV